VKGVFAKKRFKLRQDQSCFAARRALGRTFDNVAATHAGSAASLDTEEKDEDQSNECDNDRDCCSVSDIHRGMADNTYSRPWIEAHPW
jgi:hypothetical protein